MMIGLEYLRKKANLSVMQLGDKIGVSRQVIARWENKEQEIPPKRIKELANLFKVDEKYICEQVTSHYDRISIEIEQEVNSITQWEKWKENECEKDGEIYSLQSINDYMQMQCEKDKLIWQEFNKYINGEYEIYNIDGLPFYVVELKKTMANLKNIFSTNNDQIKFNELIYLKESLTATMDELQQMTDSISEIIKLTDNICDSIENMDCNDIDD